MRMPMGGAAPWNPSPSPVVYRVGYIASLEGTRDHGAGFQQLQ
jgi:hypothetical protein